MSGLQGSICKVSLGLPKLLCQRMETGGRSLGPDGKPAVFAALVLLHKLQRSGHLFEVIYLGPLLMVRVFPGA